MTSLLRSTCSIIGLTSQCTLPCRRIFAPHRIAIQSAARRTYGGSAFGGSGYRRRLNPEHVVGGTIAVCVGAWLYMESAKMESNKPNEYGRQRRDRSSLDVLMQNSVLSRQNVNEGRWWTFITHTFTHASPTHLAFNMMALWNIGRPVIMFYGTPTYVLVWLGAGVGGGALQLYWSDIMKQAVKRGVIKKPFWNLQEGASLGASGSILGMFGLMACAFPSSALQTLGFAAFSILCLENDWLPWMGHKSHLGGMGVGAIFWLLFLRRRRGW